MALVTFPGSPGWRTVDPVYRKARGRFKSPFTFKTQTQLWPGEQYVITFSLPPMVRTLAVQWIDRLTSMIRNNDYVALNLSAYLETGAPNPINLQLVDPEIPWTIDVAQIYGISFQMEEIK